MKGFLTVFTMLFMIGVLELKGSLVYIGRRLTFVGSSFSQLNARKNFPKGVLFRVVLEVKL